MQGICVRGLCNPQPVRDIPANNPSVQLREVVDRTETLEPEDSNLLCTAIRLGNLLALTSRHRLDESGTLLTSYGIGRVGQLPLTHHMNNIAFSDSRVESLGSTIANLRTLLIRSIRRRTLADGQSNRLCRSTTYGVRTAGRYSVAS